MGTDRKRGRLLLDPSEEERTPAGLRGGAGPGGGGGRGWCAPQVRDPGSKPCSQRGEGREGRVPSTEEARGLQ